MAHFLSLLTTFCVDSKVYKLFYGAGQANGHIEDECAQEKS